MSITCKLKLKPTSFSYQMGTIPWNVCMKINIWNFLSPACSPGTLALYILRSALHPALDT